LKYWDSSALVPLLVSQSNTRRVSALLKQDPAIITWWGSRVECDSAVARLEREGLLSPADAVESFSRLDALAGSWQEIQPVSILRETARRLLRSHALRSSDALQLAAAICACEGRPATLELACLDERLALAAQREGFAVVSSLLASGRGAD
jgi:predicted nucleic acid-binding protein